MGLAHILKLGSVVAGSIVFFCGTDVGSDVYHVLRGTLEDSEIFHEAKSTVSSLVKHVRATPSHARNGYDDVRRSGKQQIEPKQDEQSKAMDALPLPKSVLMKSIRVDSIDAHALHAPVYDDMEELVLYLVAPAQNDAEKVRSIFRWITANIRYDYETYKRSGYPVVDASSVFEFRKTMCSGYANLLQEMLRIAHIPSKKVSGIAMSSVQRIEAMATDADTIPTESNHAWNIVRIEGHWYALDATWSAGHVLMGEERWTQQYNDTYFCTDPKLLITTHFPIQPSGRAGQLLQEPISYTAFAERRYQ